MNRTTSSDDEFSSGRVLIATATYNEVENIPGLVDAIRELLPTADILVVDDNSPDGTGEWVRQRSQHDTQVQGIYREGKLGLGSATIAAMQFAMDRGYDFLVTMDADWSHHPRYIPAIVGAMRSTDAAVVSIGSRYVAGGGVEGWPWVRRVMSRVMNGYARWLLGLSPRDCTGAFRCYRVANLAEVDWETCQASGYAFLEEILWRLSGPGRQMVEVPIVFTDREKGQTKLGWWEAIRSVAMLARLKKDN